jgi:flagellar basal-body rod protein FlgB
MPAFDILSSQALQASALALDAAQLRQTVIAANIANASNPQYVARRVAFEERLRAALAEADRGAALLHTARPLVLTDNSEIAIDQQLAAQSANLVQTQALLKSVNAQIDLLNLASNDGRK